MILMRDDSDGSGVVFTVVAGFFFFGLRNNLFYDFRIIKKKKKNLSRFGRGFTAAIQGQWTEWPHWKQNFKDKNDNWLKLKRRN